MARGVADKRSAILRAAVRLFGAGHYHSTTIPSLAREAGVAEGSIYKSIRESADLDEETEKELRAELDKFARQFNVEEEKGLVS